MVAFSFPVGNHAIRAHYITVTPILRGLGRCNIRAKFGALNFFRSLTGRVCNSNQCGVMSVVCGVECARRAGEEKSFIFCVDGLGHYRKLKINTGSNPNSRPPNFSACGGRRLRRAFSSLASHIPHSQSSPKQNRRLRRAVSSIQPKFTTSTSVLSPFYLQQLYF